MADAGLLGALLLSAEALDAALAVGLRPDDSYGQALGRAFEAVLALTADDKPVDAVTVQAALEAAAPEALEALDGFGGLLGLQMDTPTTSNAGAYAELIRGHARRRELIAGGSCRPCVPLDFEPALPALAPGGAVR